MRQVLIINCKLLRKFVLLGRSKDVLFKQTFPLSQSNAAENGIVSTEELVSAVKDL